MISRGDWVMRHCRLSDHGTQRLRWMAAIAAPAAPGRDRAGPRRMRIDARGARLVRFRGPKRDGFLDALSENSYGKVMKRQLRDMLR
jgi:hypothetical protein